jgi:hypothetical protein
VKHICHGHYKRGTSMSSIESGSEGEDGVGEAGGHMELRRFVWAAS